MVRSAFFSTFERHVLPKMRQSLLLGRLVAATNVEHDAAMRDLGVGYLLMDNADSIRENMQLIFFVNFGECRSGDQSLACIVFVHS